MKLANKITVVLLLMTLFAVGAVAATSYWLGQNSLRRAVSAGLESTTELKGQAIEQSLRRLREDAEIAQKYYNIRANLPVVARYSTERSHPEYQRARKTLDDQLDAWVETRSEVANLLLTDREGVVVYSVVRNTSVSALDSPLPDPGAAAFRAGAKGIYVSEVFADLRGEGGVLLITAPVLDLDGEFAGVLALEVDMEAIWNYVLDSTGMGETGETVIAAGALDHALVLNPLRHDADAALTRKVPFGSAAALPIEDALAGNVGSGAAIDYRGKEVVAAWRPLPSLGWAMVTKIDRAEAFAPLRTGMWLTIGAVLGGIVIALLMSLMVSRPLSESLQSLLSVAERSQQGELGLAAEVRSRDEIGELATVFNGMLGSFRKVVEQAKKIAEGDYSTKIVPRSDKDELGIALQSMTVTLERAAAAAKAISNGQLDVEVEVKGERDLLAKSLNRMVSALRVAETQHGRHLWQARSQAGLNDAIGGNLTLRQLADTIVRYLCRLLDAQVGALYVSDDAGRLVLAGSTGQDDLPATCEPGVGLVGRVATEKERLVLTELPESYFRIRSSVGECPPKHLLVLPAIHEDEARGVLELASLSAFDEEKLGFLESVGPTIGLSISAALARDRVEELLSEAHTQTEALRAQQEELRQANDELEQQAQLLEEEREVVEAKNREILQTRHALQQRADELAQASKYKSDFLANMSHELRTPLNSLLILSGILVEDRDHTLTAKQREYAQTIQSAGGELLELINEILDLAKIEAGKMAVDVVDCPLSRIVEHLQRNFEPVARQRGVEFTVRLLPGAPASLRTDVHRLQQVLKNLLSNALKFTSEGSVTVELGGADADEEGGAAVTFAVRDTGIGIPADKQALIFEAFRQADSGTGRKYGGTGLGLSISKEIAALLGGSLTLESVVGEGTTFTLHLPVAGPPVEEGGDSAEASPSPVPAAREVGGNLRARRVDLPAAVVPDDRDRLAAGDRLLLVVEDDPAFAVLLADTARERGFKVVVAGGGADGLILARRMRPHAITLDLRLPDLSGWTVLDKLKEDPLTRSIPVHILSVDEQGGRGVMQGAIASMTKPTTPAELATVFDTIERTLASTMKRLLIVEDDEIGRRSLVELVGGTDIDTVAVASGAAALAALAEKGFDCMVVDLGLPDMDGFDFIDRVRSTPGLAELPIIVYTGRVLDAEQEVRLKAAADAIIIKDVRSPERLLAETSLFLHRVEEAPPRRPVTTASEIAEERTSLAGRRVLVVDDDARNIFALRSVLEAHGIEVTHALSGKRSLEILAHDPPPVDLVLMDIMMPEMDGYETMRQLRKYAHLGRLPIVAVTAKAMKGDRKRCLDAGASDYITKPVDSGQLLSLLRVWLYDAGPPVEGRP